jgi:hypothetical protein
VDSHLLGGATLSPCERYLVWRRRKAIASRVAYRLVLREAALYIGEDEAPLSELPAIVQLFGRHWSSVHMRWYRVTDELCALHFN